MSLCNPMIKSAGNEIIAAPLARTLCWCQCQPGTHLALSCSAVAAQVTQHLLCGRSQRRLPRVQGERVPRCQRIRPAAVRSPGALPGPAPGWQRRCRAASTQIGGAAPSWVTRWHSQHAAGTGVILLLPFSTGLRDQIALSNALILQPLASSGLGSHIGCHRSPLSTFCVLPKHRGVRIPVLGARSTPGKWH